MSGWQTMDTAPRDGTVVLLYHKYHGAISGHFYQGQWSDDTPVSPAEYDGSCWVLGDDIAQEEVEEFPYDAPVGPYGDGSITHWQPSIEPPKQTPSG